MRGPVPGGVWVVAALVLALHLACLGGYGYFRDELYFIACGHHLAWGYVDQPPLIAIIARLAEVLSFGSLTLFRLPANLAHAATVLLAGALAAKLGAGRFGSVLAGLCVGAAPVLLASGQLLTMNAFEPLLWTAVVYTLWTVLDGSSARRWLVVGGLVGVGILNKHSMVLFAVCAALACLCVGRGRQATSSRWLAWGGALAGLLVLPHAIWQAHAGFPMLELLRNGQAHKNAAFGLLALWAEQAFEMNHAALLVALAGIVWLIRRPASSGARVLGLSCVFAEVLFIGLKAKAYYLAPLYPLLFAAGGAAVDAWLSRWLRLRWLAPATIAALGALAVPAAIPLLPVGVTERYLAALGIAPPRLERLQYRVLPQYLADQVGWPELAASVAQVYSRLSPREKARALIFAHNYGEAAALDFFGAPLGLPPATSGHNSYFLWGPHGDGEVVIIIGGKELDHRRYYEHVDLVGRTAANPHGLPREDGLPIFLLRRPTIPLSELWPRLKLFI